MWTGDGRVFFYNPSTRTSVWEKPEELAKRTDVDKMTANPPDTLANNNNNSSGSTLPTKQEVLKSPGKTKRASDDSDSEAEDETPAKKSKKEDTPRKLH